MNNEPVGYVYSVAGETIKSAKINPQIPNGTPLYTHPVKELTDEEIRECIHQIDPNKTDMFMSFAKAILRKAQEK